VLVLLVPPRRQHVLVALSKHRLCLHSHLIHGLLLRLLLLCFRGDMRLPGNNRLCPQCILLSTCWNTCIPLHPVGWWAWDIIILTFTDQIDVPILVLYK
jgi:hypothetical protein